MRARAEVDQSDEFSLSRAFGADSRLSRQDLLPVIGLAAFSLLLQGYHLSAFEFFRHTEADRTLIAWEMMERGNYVVPRLLGAEIITKPPLFYWSLAASFRLFGVSEWAARLPSVLFALIFVLMQYVVVRRVGAKPAQALCSALMLSTGILFVSLSAAAEIDMMFGLVSAAALYGLYFALTRGSFSRLLCAYAAAAAAFLIKGPPIVFFFGAALVFFHLWQRYARRDQAPWLRFVLWNAAGAATFFGITFLWLAAVADKMGWAALYREFDIEVFQRVVAPARHERGPLFYLVSLAGGLAPWSLLLLAAGFSSASRRSWSDFTAQMSRAPEGLKQFLTFSLITTLSGLLMLTLAESKSSRYIFPVYVFAMNLCFGALVASYESGKLRRWARTLRVAAPVAALGAAGAAAAAYLKLYPQIDVISLMTAALIVLCALTALLYGERTGRTPVLFGAVLMLIFGARVVEKDLFAPYRNAARSVKQVAVEIDNLLPSGSSLYTIEMFERWIVYYLKHQGRQTYRLTPSLAAGPLSRSGRVFLLLNSDEESWRLPQLALHDPTLRLIKRFDIGKDSPMLVDVDAVVLPHVRPHQSFPTFPSPPYYTAEERRALNVEDGKVPDSPFVSDLGRD